MTLRMRPTLAALGLIASPAFALLGSSIASEPHISPSDEEHALAGRAEVGSLVEADVDSLFGSLVEADLVSGSILLARSGKVLVAKGYGLADREHGTPNTMETPFRVASVSKAITATAVLHLLDAGRLTMDSKLESYVPGFPEGDRITVEHLLSHRSGIPSDVYLVGFGEMSIQSLTLEEAIDWARATARPRFEPGTRFEYSNTGYLLLTAVIEKASGLPFEQYLAEHVFGPSGMTSSGLDSATRILAGRARGYSRSELGEVVNTAYRDPTFGWGYGALYSTVLDLLRFDQALTDGRLLSEASRRMMWTAYSDTPWGNRYGMGWFIDDLAGHRSVTALGSTGSFMAILRHYVAEDIVIVALLNQDFMLYRELYA